MPRTRLERFGLVRRTYGRRINVSIFSDSSDSDSDTHSIRYSISSADSSEPSHEPEQSDSDNDQNSISNENDDDNPQSDDSEGEGEDAHSDNENDNQSDDTESVMSRESLHSNDSNNSHRGTNRILESPSIDSDSNSNSVSTRSETNRRRSRHVIGSDSEIDDDDDFTMEFSSRRRSRSNSSSSRNSLEEESIFSNDDSLSMSFRPLRLPLPGTPSPSLRSSSTSSSSSSSNSSVANDSPAPEEALGEFFHRLAQQQQNDHADVPPVFHPVPHSYGGVGMADSRPSTSETGTVSFECCVCLENLDAPASLDDFPGRNVPDVVPNALRDHSPLMLPGRRSTQLANGSILKDTDVVATHCGHLYHQVCLEKWFLEQGKRTCPSCRKSVPKSKVIRIYPNLSTDSGGQNGGPGSPTPGTSSRSGRQASSSSSSSANGSSSTKNQLNGGEGDGNTCGQMECQDLKVLHATLMNDYTELQARYETLRENDELKEAQILSLEEDNARKSREIERLKRGLEETQAGTSSSDPSSLNSAKRRRY